VAKIWTLSFVVVAVMEVVIFRALPLTVDADSVWHFDDVDVDVDVDRFVLRKESQDWTKKG